jgi:hypothetical protein
LGGVPPSKPVYIPAFQEGFLLATWFVYQLLGRNPKLVYNLPTSWFVHQLVGRGSFQPSRLHGFNSREESLPAVEVQLVVFYFN